jgi:hypothetical protein
MSIAAFSSVEAPTPASPRAICGLNPALRRSRSTGVGAADATLRSTGAIVAMSCWSMLFRLWISERMPSMPPLA